MLRRRVETSWKKLLFANGKAFFGVFSFQPSLVKSTVQTKQYYHNLSFDK